MLLKWGRMAVASAAALAAVIAVATTWGFYPIGLILLLAVGLLAAVILLFGNQWRSRPVATSTEEERRQRRHDARLVAELRAILPRSSIEWVRTWDFGNSWRQDEIRPYFTFVYTFDNVEHRPLDSELAEAVARLLDATDKLTRVHALESFPERGTANDWRSTGVEDAPGGKYGRFIELHRGRQRKLNDAADPVGEAYDAVIDVARRKALLEVGPAQ